MKLALLLGLVGALTLPRLARADVPNPEDPYAACKSLTKGAPCSDGSFDGACVEAACPGDPAKTCLYCQEGATPTTGAGESTGATGTTATTVVTGTTDVVNPEPEDKGCGCRGDAGGPAALLAAVALLARRRRR